MTRLTKFLVLLAVIAVTSTSLGFSPESSDAKRVLTRFINDLQSGDAVHLDPWLEKSGLDTGHDVLTDKTIQYVDVLFPPVISEDQMAAIIIVWDTQERAYATYALFFRKSADGWRLYGFFPERTLKRGSTAE